MNRPEENLPAAAVGEKDSCTCDLRSLRRHFGFFGGLSALYALFYTFCIYRNGSGITYPFFAAGTFVYFGLCMKKSGVPWKKGSIFYAASILLLAVSVCLTDNLFIHALTRACILLLVIVLMLHQFLDDSRWDFTSFLTAIGQGILETIACLWDPVSDGNAWLKSREENGQRGRMRYVLLGLLLLVPLLTVVVLLLMSADPVFFELLTGFFTRIKGEDLIGMFFLTLGMFLASYCFTAMLDKGMIRVKGGEKGTREPAVAVTVTGVLTAVYLLFCGIQIYCLFLGKGTLPEGYTYSSYARQGFFQLLAVCLINLALVLICLRMFRESRALKGILTVLSVCTYVLAASSAWRMLLYIQEYRLTFLRFLVLWALAAIAVLLTGIVAGIHRPGFPLFGFCAAAVTVCCIFLAYVQPDYWIARYNVSSLQAQENAGEQVREPDLRYLASLSADAAPVLASGENYRIFAECSGEMRLYYEEVEKKAEKMGLRSFNLSRFRAGRAVKTASENTQNNGSIGKHTG